ncbi:hypothetical protein OFN63_25280, partial [Escherichia coli]|nr:hypothetical protein [Escherichia coli]
MSIKQSIAALVILLSVSFSANAETLYKVNNIQWGGSPLQVSAIYAESYLLDLSWGNFGNCSISYGQFYCLQHGSSNPNLIAKMQKYVC